MTLNQMTMTDFGEILKNVGEFGRFQKFLVFMLCFLNFFNAFYMFGQVFMAISVPHHCNTSWILENSPNITEEDQLNLTIPRTEHGSYEQCVMYTPVDWDLESIQRYGLNDSEDCRNGWVYDTSQQKSTLVIEFDLVCHRKEQTELCQSIYMLGLLLGSIIFGHLGDRSGRRPVILISTLLMLAFGLGAAFVAEFYVFMVLRCFVGIAMAGILINNVVLVAEWVGPSQRAYATITGHVCFAIGLMVLAGIGYAIRNWRLLQIACAAPTALLVFYIWFANSLVYYGLSLNVGSFGLNIYLTQLIFGAVEIPARIGSMFTAQFFGRRLSQSLFLLLGGTACLIITAIPKQLSVGITVLAVIGKFATASSYSICYIYAAELFPTIIRQNGVGLCSMTARLAGIIAPLISLLDKYHPAIPMAIYGSGPIIGGLFCFLLPETLGKNLQDHTFEVNNIPRSDSLPKDNLSNSHTLNGESEEKKSTQL
ncbi:solute carrier family 22 member 13-like isoform X2 [Ranitomeya imitator]|uniref:solute carrier family 22 member 13-like isoform X2 n=1 Tax=Ranitomeya imitator TaxID=111125 RepID=UPI0037E7F56D